MVMNWYVHGVEIHENAGSKRQNRSALRYPEGGVPQRRGDGAHWQMKTDMHGRRARFSGPPEETCGPEKRYRNPGREADPAKGGGLASTRISSAKSALRRCRTSVSVGGEGHLQRTALV